MGRCAYRCGVAVEGWEESVLVFLRFSDTCYSVLAVVLLFFRSSEAEDDSPSVWGVHELSQGFQVAKRSHIHGHI